MPTGLKGRHKVPKTVYVRNTATVDLVAEEEREARRKAAAELVAAEQRALEARIAAEKRTEPPSVIPVPRGKLIFVKEAPAPAKTRDWNMQDVIYNLRQGYTVEYVAWRTKYPIEVVRAVEDGL